MLRRRYMLHHSTVDPVQESVLLNASDVEQYGDEIIDTTRPSSVRINVNTDIPAGTTCRLKFEYYFKLKRNPNAPYEATARVSFRAINSYSTIVGMVKNYSYDWQEASGTVDLVFTTTANVSAGDAAVEFIHNYYYGVYKVTNLVMTVE